MKALGRHMLQKSPKKLEDWQCHLFAIVSATIGVAKGDESIARCNDGVIADGRLVYVAS